jgi:Malectin domain
MCKPEFMLKLLVVISATLTNATAFEQIDAINIGGEAHTDSDGIRYRKYDGIREDSDSGSMFDLKDVPESDRVLYQYGDLVRSHQNKTLKYKIPLRNDGTYLLIAKFFNNFGAHEQLTQEMTLNAEVQLQPEVNLFNLCGGYRKVCDAHFYFCVLNRKLYYGNQSTDIQNDEINIEIRPINKAASVSALVLLKGVPGERQSLKSSAAQPSLYYDSMGMNKICSSKDFLWNEIRLVQEHQRENTNQCQHSSKCTTNLCDGVQAAIHDTKAAINGLTEQQSEKFLNLEQKISKIVEMKSSMEGKNHKSTKQNYIKLGKKSI